MFRIPSPGRNDVIEMGPGCGKVLFRDQPVCLNGKSDEYAHEKKDDNETDINEKPIPQLLLFHCRCRDFRHVSALLRNLIFWGHSVITCLV
jgi:hypothetical protein